MTEAPKAGRPFREHVAGALEGVLEGQQRSHGVLVGQLGEVGEHLAGVEVELSQVDEALRALAADRDADAAAFRGMVVTRRVVVNLKSGTALAGLVVRHDGPLLEVADVALLLDGSDPRPVDGRVVVERGDVDFIQVLA